jgi:hypothetical protein
MENVHIPYEQLIAHANRELTESESAVVAAHTAACAECNSTVLYFRSIRGLLRTDYTRYPPAATVVRAQSIFHEYWAKPQPRPQQRAKWSEFFQAKVRPVAAMGLAALILAFMLVLGQSTIAAANEAIPGDTLYPIKIGMENLQLVVGIDKKSKIEFLFTIAQHRIDEIVTLNEIGRYNYISSTTIAYEKATHQAANIVGEVAQENTDNAAMLGAKANADLSKNIAILATLQDQVPDQAKSAIAHAISESQNDRLTIEEQAKPGNKGKTPTQTRPSSPVVLPSATRVMPVDPPGLQKTPGPPAIPPGKFVTPGVPPGRDATSGPPGPPPGQVKTPGPPEAPPGQLKTPGPPEVPPGQMKTPGPPEVPPGQQKKP